MQMGQPARVDDVERIPEHRFRFRRKSRDDVGTENNVRAQVPNILAKPDRVGPEMTAFHPFQDHVVTCLERQMKMRHQPFVFGNHPHEIVIGFDRIDGR
jgi:hypothetical protein